jgi:hypothetical protein
MRPLFCIKKYQMRKIAPVLLSLVMLTCFVSAYSQQPTTKEYKVGHVFSITLPTYMSKTIGLNDAADMQYKSEVKDVYGFVVVDAKEELKLAEIKYTSIQEFYDEFIPDFTKDDEKKTIGKPVSSTKNGINFIEVDYTFYSKDAESDIYYLIGIVETKKAYYKVMSWCTAANKAKFKADFQKILYSIKD